MTRPNRLLTLALSIQLVLALFCPPFALGERLLFLSDIWIFLWTPVFAVIAYREADLKDRRFLLKATLGLFVLFTIIFFHGMERPPLTAEFIHYIGDSKDDAFSIGKEAVVAFRFFTWCIAALVVSRFDVDLRFLKKALAICAGIAALSIIAASISAEVRAGLGVLYRYDPYAQPWPERIYGVFRSPIEGCLTLCLSFLLLLRGEWKRPMLKSAALAFIGAGILLTKTLAGVLGLGVGIVYATSSTLPPKKVKAFLISAALAFSALVFLEWNSAYLTLKRGNLVFRLKPWALYWKIATSRFDHFLFGTGFHSHFTDSIYLFFFSRGGMLFLGAAIAALFGWWKRNGKNLQSWEKAIPLFFLVSGLVVDNLIMRPVAYLFIACAIRALKGSKSTSQA